MDIGFIGLGTMGAPMAKRLIDAGHRLRVWNRSPARVAQLEEAGATVAATPSEASAGDALITMMADDRALQALIEEHDLLSHGRCKVHVNMATVSTIFVRKLVAMHDEAGVTYLSAPVFGRPEAAAAGALTILAAGSAAAREACWPLFQAMGRRIWNLGDDPVAANIVKICGNLMVANAIESMGESIALAGASGVDPQQFCDIFVDALFDGPVYRAYGDIIAGRRFDPAGFRLVLGLKDVELALAAGSEARVPLPFASVVRDRMLEAVAQGDGDKDWSFVGGLASERAGLSCNQSRESS